MEKFETKKFPYYFDIKDGVLDEQNKCVSFPSSECDNSIDKMCNYDLGTIDATFSELMKKYPGFTFSNWKSDKNRVLFFYTPKA